jgi:hypothetical protein
MFPEPRGAVPFQGRVPTVTTIPSAESFDELNPFARFAGSPSDSFDLVDDDDDDDPDDDDFDDDDDDDFEDDDDDLDDDDD